MGRRTSWPAKREQEGQALRRVAVVVHDEHPQPAARPAAGDDSVRDAAAGPPAGARAAGATGTRFHGRAPSLCASTVPPCISTSARTSASPIPSPPCGAVERRVDLGEEVEHARQVVGRDPDAGVLHAHRDLALARRAR